MPRETKLDRLMAEQRAWEDMSKAFRAMARKAEKHAKDIWAESLPLRRTKRAKDLKGMYGAYIAKNIAWNREPMYGRKVNLVKVTPKWTTVEYKGNHWNIRTLYLSVDEPGSIEINRTMARVLSA